ncbi:AIG1 family-domain-containing protein [Jimgerdemannia flammicorona]|uniref:AIG1 family-domain-containing protein n=1 Tax=Jimgerdemannia flammicorona TaxID=994334 RepID=A0A433DIC5_9FUNG|nr:AIG1 family-domain-containing protein [Jimgerdemannia flammicorona]
MQEFILESQITPEATLCSDICSPAILIVGKTGAGKSTLGNILIGQPAYEGPFKTSNSFDSVSQECETFGMFMADRHLNVVDTPGIFDTERPDEVTLAKIGEVVQLCSYGIQAIIFVLEAGRFTAEQEEVVRKITEYFGPESLGHTIVVFTKCNIEQTVDPSVMSGAFNEQLRSLLSTVDGRWAIVPNPDVFDERDDVFIQQISHIRQMILQMMSVYTIALFERVRQTRETQSRIIEEDRTWAAQQEEDRLRNLAQNEALEALERRRAEQRRQAQQELEAAAASGQNRLNEQVRNLEAQAARQRQDVEEMQRRINNAG